MTVVHEICWTPRLVESQLVEAADTLRRLPERFGNRYFSTWPPINERCRADCMPARTKMWSSPPSAAAIDRMDAALLWLRWLDRREQQIVWQRADGCPWKIIAASQAIDRTTAWRHWTSALIDIGATLNMQQQLSTKPSATIAPSKKSSDATLFYATDRRVSGMFRV
jgi:hypothetical protein